MCTPSRSSRSAGRGCSTRSARSTSAGTSTKRSPQQGSSSGCPWRRKTRPCECRRSWMHDHLQELLIRYGLLAVLFGSAFEGDFTLILAGVVAHLGIFAFPLAVAAGAAGSLIGDSAWYALGRLRGPRF